MTSRTKSLMEIKNESPILIGGVGGSGTRAVCKILMEMGFYMGSNFNFAYDEVIFNPFFKNWIRPLLENPSLEKKNKIKKIFLDCLSNYLKTKPDTKNWGFKRPRNILILPFLNQIFPKMKFIQVIRDGRDMALSKNQKQVELFGDLICKDTFSNSFLYRLEFWSRVNLSSHDYGKLYLKNNYFAIRYEDLINDPVKTIERLTNFTNLDFHKPSNIESIIQDPKTIGRWKKREIEFSNLPPIAKKALDKFHYLN